MQSGRNPGASQPDAFVKTLMRAENAADSGDSDQGEEENSHTPADTGMLEMYSSLLQLFAKQRSGAGVYRIEGNWLLLADVPQALYARDAQTAAKTNTTLATWLAGTQQQDRAQSMLGVSTRTNGWAKMGYQYYLQTLVALANLMDTQVPIEAMPSALELNLPASGAIGFSMDRLARGVAFRVNYENSPLEIGGGGGMTSVAVVAMLAAIALPAYQDYTVRAEVADAIAETGAAKLELLEAAYAAGRIPKKFSFTSEFGARVASVDWLDQAIVVTFSDSAASALKNHTLALGACVDPKNRQDIVAWACGLAACENGVPLVDAAVLTTVAAKHLPSSCR
jgi:Tfp pilus assembly major pilin PilA